MKPRWSLIELFAAMQILWGALLFLPGVQPYRAYVRGFPYIASLAALVYFMGRSSSAPVSGSGKWLLASLALLAANLLHAETHLSAGIAQVILQLSIAAPMFWAAWIVGTNAQLARLLWTVFVASLASAALGILQVYYPDVFLPSEFSSLGQRLNPDIVHALTYEGAEGRAIIRPPGFSDLPGGAAVAGLCTVLLGLAYVSHEHSGKARRIFCVASAAIGMTVLYLTQVRSLTVMAVLSVLIFAGMRLRQGRILRGGGIAVAVAIAALAAASFFWATTIGGSAVEARFSGLLGTGLIDTFRESRGTFLTHTVRELAFTYPLGAGLGRWGMMQVYFQDPSMWHTPPIYVEIQPTGWLLDGGILMWLFYGGALACAVSLSYVSAIRRRTESERYVAATVLAFQLGIIGLCLTGPVFNTQLGMLFWLVTGALYGANRADADQAGGEVEDR